MSRIPRAYPPIAILLILILTGCNLPTQSQETTSPEFTPISELQQTMVTFRLILPEPIQAGNSIYLTLLDEVSGLGLNPHKYIMQAVDDLHYSVALPFYLGKVLKYRYSREGASTVDEHLNNAQAVRYRIFHVEGPGTVDDVLSQWTDSNYQTPSGRIMGTVTDKNTGKPAPNILVTAGGEQTFTMADGTFLLESLPAGTHNLVFYALDGLYSIYQQGAVVASGSTTPVTIALSPARLVTVIFAVKVPAGTPADAPMRLAGNLSQLGNTFADLSGGVSELPSHMPVLGKLSDGRYMVTLSLPAGAYIEYKYTLGDGLWSAEVTSQGRFVLRQLIVPDTGLQVDDTVDAWNIPNTKTIRFEVKIPSNTPSNETISIQFNPGFGWLEPLLMWPAQETAQPVWRFDLTSPFNNLTELHYRYCRQEQCGAADDSATMGAYPEGRITNPSANPGIVKDEILSWAWYSGPSTPPSVPGVQVNPREAGFTSVIALQPAYQPSWGDLLPSAFQDIQNLGVNSVLLSPTWTFSNSTPPVLGPIPAQDMLYPDLLSAIRSAQAINLSVGLFPQTRFTTSADQWWHDAARDYPWWLSFFERYQNFIVHNATIASETGANNLVLGGDWLAPALPGGVLTDGTASGVPQDAEVIWRSLIGKVRERYSGTISWALAYPEGVTNPPPFLDAVDQVYIQWSAALATQPGASQEEMLAQASAILDQDILPFQQQLGKPIILAISYPSIDRGATGCITIQGGGCLDYALLSPPNTDIPDLKLDLQVQSDAYNAVLTAINDRPWIAGFVSMGYYPPAALQDKSPSIHGKPASGVLWYWSTKFLGR
jgi:Glycoside Hydrolase Family 113/Carboxypeptidase regulatory-like domain